jgi:hypothetical protein
MNLLLFFHRYQPELHCAFWIKLSPGAMLGMAFVGLLRGVSGKPLVSTPFGMPVFFCLPF